MIRLARHDVRVHVRRRVVHIPVRETALRRITAVATEQGKDAHRFPYHVKVIIFSCRRFYHNFSRLCRSLALFPKSWKIPLRSMPRRVNPPNLPLRGSKLPRSPSAATQQQAVCKKGSPRGACSRSSQGRAHASTRDRTSTHYRGSHRTGQLLQSHC